jgi:hypothetical protein
MKQQIHLRGRITELAAATVATLLGAGQMARIQAVDQEPFFFELVLAHEGTSNGSLNGFTVVKEWLKRTVQAVAHAFTPQGRIPASIYDGIDHWHGNEVGRVPVGEIVDARPVAERGIETARAIGWVYPQFGDVREFIRTGARDCCSIEADVEAETINGRVVVQDVLRGVGVVLGHTSKQTPGFAGAKIRKLTEFGPEEASSSGSPTPAGASSGQQGQSTVPAAAEVAPTSAPSFTNEQLVAAIRAANLKPAEVWPELAAEPKPLPSPIPTPPEQPMAPAVDPLIEGNPFL